MNHSFRPRDLVALPRIRAHRAIAIGEALATIADAELLAEPVAKAARLLKRDHAALARAVRERVDAAPITEPLEAFFESVRQYVLQVSAHAALEGPSARAQARRLLAPMSEWRAVRRPSGRVRPDAGRTPNAIRTFERRC